MRNKTIIIRVTESERNALDIYCKDKDISTSEAVRILMAEKLAYYIIDRPKDA